MPPLFASYPQVLQVPALAAAVAAHPVDRGAGGGKGGGAAVMPLEVMVALIVHIHTSRFESDNGSGAVLAFLPGWSEIARVQRLLEVSHWPYSCDNPDG